MNRRSLIAIIFVAAAFLLSGSKADAAAVSFDRFTRSEAEVTPFLLQNHQSINGGTWTKSVGTGNYQLTSATSSLAQSATGVIRYYNGETVSSDLEVGLLVNTNGASGTNNYMAPIVRTNSAGNSGIWAEMDFSAGTVRLRAAYSPYAYISNNSTSTGYSFPSGDYYIVIGASGTTYSAYIKQMSTGMWLNPTNKLFDSPSRVAIIVAESVSQTGTLVGIGGFTSTGSPLAKQMDVGDVGSLGSPVVSAPSQPISPSIVPGDSSVDLSWTAPLSNGGSPITFYNIYNDASDTFVASTSALSATVSGLTNGTAYSYYVTASNSTAESASSSVVSAIPYSGANPDTIDSFVRSIVETTPFALENHQADNGSSWTKSLSQSYALSATSSSLQQAPGGGSATRYYNSTVVDTDTEVGLLVDTAGAVGANNYMAPIVRTNSAGNSGIWAEMDISTGRVGLRRAYTPFVYISAATTTGSGFSFPADEYYLVLGVTGSNYSMYVKRMSTDLWLNPLTKSFDSSLRMAVATGTDSQAGGLIGIGGFTTSAGTSSKGVQIDAGGVGTLLEPTVPDNILPTQPLNLEATPSDERILLSWDEPSDEGSSAVSSYSVYSHPSNALATTTASTSVLFEALTNGTAYSYYVTASNTVGESASSTVVSATPFATTTVAVTDPSFDSGLSPYVWYRGDGFVTTAGGSNAYFKVGFTGTRFGIVVDVSTQVAASMNAIAYPILKYRIDGGEYELIQLSSTSTSVTLASGLEDGDHTVEAYYQRNMYYDSWNTPVQQLKITALTLDEGATLTDFPMRPRNMLVYGDSIAEGQWIEQTSSGNTGQSGQGALIANSTRVYITQLAEALDVEFGNTAVGGQGWAGGGLTNVPNLVSAWDLYFSGRSRLTGGKILPNPDIVFINMGTNGGVSASSTVTNWLTSLRSAVSTSTIIYLNIPFNGTGRTNITAGFNGYMASNASDRTYLIDLGTISGYTTTDGLHPNGAGNDRVAELLEAAIESITVPSAPLDPQISLEGLTAHVSWDAPASTGSSTLLGYNVYLYPSNELATTTTGTSTDFENLEYDSVHSYYVRAFNALGESAATDIVSVTTPEDPNEGTVEESRPVPPPPSSSASRRQANLLAMGQKAQSDAAQTSVSVDRNVLQRLISTLLGETVVTSESPTAPTLSSCQDMTLGSAGDCVLLLQRYLNGKGFIVSFSGAGSPGLETKYFGVATRSALSNYQTSSGITPAVGYFGPKTRATIEP